ncbi:MAG: AtpZ/AtpI family protein [Acidisphaera sp.]|nr:AtpZ/AtpI family protein [Acidisphaera sp.]
MDEEPGGDDVSFEERLRAARGRQRLDGPPAGKGPSDPFAGSPWAIGLRVGVELVAALAVGVAIGWALDRWLGTRPVFLSLFFLLGGAAGVRNVWRVFSR